MKRDEASFRQCTGITEPRQSASSKLFEPPFLRNQQAAKRRRPWSISYCNILLWKRLRSISVVDATSSELATVLRPRCNPCRSVDFIALEDVTRY